MHSNNESESNAFLNNPLSQISFIQNNDDNSIIVQDKNPTNSYFNY